ncbi:hypothetical protein F0562_006727 [Nyssa sinensis]|uniref:Uncharacterized protein n=1 Tax=Nyssa sinensis TaxID=561372 RepID=A0A5J5ASZ5_9ASTE|nr:hypothetical protein F0562_006727 [Nyssa sinensis]
MTDDDDEDIEEEEEDGNFWKWEVELLSRQKEVVKNMIRVIGLLESVETVLHGAAVANEGLREVLSGIEDGGNRAKSMMKLTVSQDRVPSNTQTPS